MEYFNNTIAIPYQMLVPDIMSVANYRYFHNNRKLSVLRRGCKNTPALIEWDSLPDRIKDACKQKYGSDIEAQALRNPLEKYLENDIAAYDFFCAHIKPDGKHLTPEKVREYTGNAIALRAIIQLFDNKKAKTRALGSKMDVKQTYESILKALKVLQSKWGWKMPSSERALRIKITNFRKEGYASLIHSGVGNENSTKVADNEQAAVLRSLLRHNRNFNDVQIQKMYNETAKVLGWKTISEKTVGKRRKEWHLFIEARRRGETEFMNNIAMQAKRKNPLHPLLFWTFDGWDAELLYQKTETNEKGHNRTTYSNRLKILVVIDACTKYPVGYAIGLTENADLIKQALRNALTHTKELFGCIHRPQQVQSDRFAISAFASFVEQMTPKFTAARKHNAKAKPIEPYFKALNVNYCQFYTNWGGFGVTADKDNQPNIDYMNVIKKNFPDEAGCRAQLVEVMEKERAAKKTAFLERWNDLPDDLKLPWTTEQYLDHCGESTGFTNQMRGEGLIMTIGGEKHTYDSFDLNFRKYPGVKWAIKFDRSDLSTVLACNEDRTLRFLLEEKYVQPMALAERQEGDAAQLARLNQFNLEQAKIVKTSTVEDDRQTLFLYSTHPELDQTLAKFQLTDSLGQHKNNLKSIPAEQAAQFKITEAKKEAKTERKQAAIEKAENEARMEQYIDSKTDYDKYLK